VTSLYFFHAAKMLFIKVLPISLNVAGEKMRAGEIGG
jgi:hypothetical protein